MRSKSHNFLFLEWGIINGDKSNIAAIHTANKCPLITRQNLYQVIIHIRTTCYNKQQYQQQQHQQSLQCS